MIETEQTVEIGVGIDLVWAYVQDINNWATFMPGLKEYTVVDADDSRWTLKVGVAGLVRTVNVHVHVDQWAGPERALFSYKLQGDPVQGGGAYTARAAGPDKTEVILQVRVEGGGPMAPMWEAMGRPVLPQLAKSFAKQLKTEIEKVAAGVPGESPAEEAERRSLLGRIWGAVRGSGSGHEAS